MPILVSESYVGIEMSPIMVGKKLSGFNVHVSKPIIGFSGKTTLESMNLRNRLGNLFGILLVLVCFLHTKQFSRIPGEESVKDYRG